MPARAATVSIYLLVAMATLLGIRPVQAGPALVYEPATDRVLYAQAPDQFWFPASLTKLMTAYLTFEAVEKGPLTLESKLVLSDYARSQPATRVGLRAGIDVSIDFAVRALIIRSANDFAVALAETIAGSEAAFIKRMNETALRLHMNRTWFSNPHGLPDTTMVTSARDMAKLTTALLDDFPQYADVFSDRAVSMPKLTLHTHNELLVSFDGTDGMKTGFTCSSGYNIVVSATRGERKLIAIVLGALTKKERMTRARKLLEHAFNVYDETMARKAPVHLDALPKDPVQPVPPVDLKHETRTWKCGNSPRKRSARKR